MGLQSRALLLDGQPPQTAMNVSCNTSSPSSAGIARRSLAATHGACRSNSALSALESPTATTSSTSSSLIATSLDACGYALVHCATYEFSSAGQRVPSVLVRYWGAALHRPAIPCVELEAPLWLLKRTPLAAGDCRHVVVCLRSRPSREGQADWSARGRLGDKSDAGHVVHMGLG